MDTLLPDVPDPARPYTVTVSLALPDCRDPAWLESFAEAVQAVTARLGTAAVTVVFTAPVLRVGVEVAARSRGEAVLEAARQCGDAAAGWLAVDGAETGSGG